VELAVFCKLPVLIEHTKMSDMVTTNVILQPSETNISLYDLIVLLSAVNK